MAIALKMYFELKLANWQTMSNGQNFFKKYPMILKKIQAMPDQNWMLPIAKYAHDFPMEYTIITLTSVSVFVGLLQFLINRIVWRR